MVQWNGMDEGKRKSREPTRNAPQPPPRFVHSIEYLSADQRLGVLPFCAAVPTDCSY